MSGVPCCGNGDGHEHGCLDALAISLWVRRRTPLREEWGFVFLQIYPPAHTKMKVGEDFETEHTALAPSTMKIKDELPDGNIIVSPNVSVVWSFRQPGFTGHRIPQHFF